MVSNWWWVITERNRGVPVFLFFWVSVKVILCIVCLEDKKQGFVLVQCFCTQMCKMTAKSRQWVVRVLSHMQTQGKQLRRLDVAGVHGTLNCGCVAVTAWKEIFRGMDFYFQECYKAKGFTSLFLRLVVLWSNTWSITSWRVCALRNPFTAKAAWHQLRGWKFVSEK